LNHARAGRVALIASPVHQAEIAAISDLEEREQLLSLLKQIGHSVSLDRVAVRGRAEVLVRAGLGPADAAHLAFVEATEADFVTCDDRLLKQCRRVEPRVWCGSPLLYCDKENLR
jgi:predicted nucleic acid-binding protein